MFWSSESGASAHSGGPARESEFDAGMALHASSA